MKIRKKGKEAGRKKKKKQVEENFYAASNPSDLSKKEPGWVVISVFFLLLSVCLSTNHLPEYI